MDNKKLEDEMVARFKNKKKSSTESSANSSNAQKKSAKGKVNKKTKAKKSYKTKTKKSKNKPKKEDKPRTSKVRKRTKDINKLIDNKELKVNTLTSKEKKEMSRNFKIILIIFLFLFVLVILRVAYLEAFHTVHYISADEGIGSVNLEDYAHQQYSQENVDEAQRGVIYDSNGDPLAVNIETYKIIAHLDPKHKKYDSKKLEYVPDYIKDPDKTAEELIKDLGYEDDVNAQNMIESQLNKDPNKYSQVEFGVYGEDVTVEQKEKIEKDHIPGIEFQETTQRYYPYGDFASYVIGYANTDDKGNITGESGIEGALDDYLEGQDGKSITEVDNNGVATNNSIITSEKIDGADVHLTLNSMIESFVHDSMEKHLNGQEYERASTVVMDANDGSVLAAESFPSFDPNKKDLETYQNPFTDACAEPGSVMKTFLVATAIKENVWDPNNKVDSGIRYNKDWGDNPKTGKPNSVADWLYNDDNRDWGTITWQQGYYFSSNVTMTYILDAVGYSNWIDSAKDEYEFGTPVSDQLMTTSSCDFSPEYNLETATTTFGQGMTANIMQILRGYSTFANDGKMLNPYIVKSINDPETGEKIYSGKTDHPQNWKAGKKGVEVDSKTGEYSKEILTPSQNQEVLDLMRGAVTYNKGGDFYGTGVGYQKNVNYKIGGKTGTSQISVDGSYDNDDSLYSVVIIAPIDDPQIVYYTSVLNPATTYPQEYMEKYTASTINNTLDYLLQEEISTSTKEEKASQITVPDVKGKSESEAATNLAEEGLNYKYIGSGNVSNQYPEEGSSYIENGEVILLGSNYKKEDFIGLDYYEASTYANMLSLDIDIKGNNDGNIVSIKSNRNKYILKME